MSVSIRPLLAPGVAMVTAGAIALTPAVVAPPPEITATPTVHVENIALTGFFSDLYFQAIQPAVASGVAWAAAGVSLVPVVGPPLASQININYGAISGAIGSFVIYGAGLVASPLNFIPLTSTLIGNLGVTAYNWGVAQLQFFTGIYIPPLPPILAATRAAATPARAAASGPADIPAAVRSVITARVEAAAEIRAAVTSAVEETHQEIKSIASNVRRVAATGTPAEVRDAARRAGAEISGAVKSARDEVRTTAKAARGEVRAAVKAARDSVKASGEAAD